MSRPRVKDPSIWVAAPVVFGGLGALLCLNKATGAWGARELAYWQLLALPWALWALLFVLNWVLPSKRRRKP